MRLTIHNKHIQICFLLCSLLFLELFNYGMFSLAPSGIAGLNIPAAGWSSEARSAMSDSANADSVIGALAGVRLSHVPAGKMRGLGFNNNYFFAGIIAAVLLTGLINYLRLSSTRYFQFDSLQIATFLHKKDGKK